MDWIKKLSPLRDVISSIRESGKYIPSAERAIEEELKIPSGRFVPKKLPLAIENKYVKDVINSGTEPIPIKYFMDGFQRTLLVGHIIHRGLMPVHLHVSGVVIVDVQGKVIHGPEIQVKLIVPKKSLLLSSIIEELGGIIEETRDMGEPTYDYAKLRQRGFYKSSHLRRKLEVKALRDFKPHDGFIAVDGYIPDDRELLRRKEIIGIVKTHMARYLRLDEELKVFSMPEGYRSWLIRIPRLEGDLYTLSCYLRLRRVGINPLSGLVRIEVNPANKDCIDGICLAIYNKRVPVQLRTKDWDRKLYQFYCCERILASHMPSSEALYAIFRG